MKFCAIFLRIPASNGGYGLLNVSSSISTSSPLSGPSSLLIRMPERVAQTALTFCLLPLVSSQHSSQRELSGSVILVGISYSQLHHCSTEKTEDLHVIPRASHAGPCLPLQHHLLPPFPSLRHHVTFSSSSAVGGFLFSLPPRQSILQVKHHFLWKVLFYP